IGIATLPLLEEQPLIICRGLSHLSTAPVRRVCRDHSPHVATCLLSLMTGRSFIRCAHPLQHCLARNAGCDKERHPARLKTPGTPDTIASRRCSPALLTFGVVCWNSSAVRQTISHIAFSNNCTRAGFREA